jgi:hypothetical protein
MNKNFHLTVPFDLTVLVELVLLGDLPSLELHGLHLDVAFGEEDLEVVDVLADGAQGLLEAGQALQHLGQGPQLLVQRVDRPILRVALLLHRPHPLVRRLHEEKRTEGAEGGGELPVKERE